MIATILSVAISLGALSLSGAAFVVARKNENRERNMAVAKLTAEMRALYARLESRPKKARDGRRAILAKLGALNSGQRMVADQQVENFAQQLDAIQTWLEVQPELPCISQSDELDRVFIGAFEKYEKLKYLQLALDEFDQDTRRKHSAPPKSLGLD